MLKVSNWLDSELISFLTPSARQIWFFWIVAMHFFLLFFLMWTMNRLFSYFPRSSLSIFHDPVERTVFTNLKWTNFTFKMHRLTSGKWLIMKKVMMKAFCDATSLTIWKLKKFNIFNNSSFCSYLCLAMSRLPDIGLFTFSFFHLTYLHEILWANNKSNVK